MIPYTIRRASGEDDITTMISLRAEAETWLRDAGIAQWTEDYSEYAQGVLRESVENRVAWIVLGPSGEAAGTVTLNGPDRDFWTPADDPDDALYVMKMIVQRAHRGHGLGDAILDWASRRTADARRSWLRLDCRRDNHQLHRYYQRRGFEYVRTVWPPPRRTESGALFQRVAGLTVSVPLADEDWRAVLTEHGTSPSSE